MVRQQADALMLCGETAAGLFPDKCVGVLRAVATSIEEWCRCSTAHASVGAGELPTRFTKIHSKQAKSNQGLQISWYGRAARGGHQHRGVVQVQHRPCFDACPRFRSLA